MTTYEDSYKRLDALALQLEAQLARRFMEVVRTIKSKATLDRLTELLSTGRYEEALTGSHLTALGLGAEWNAMYMKAAKSTAGFLTQTLDVVIDFNQINARAVKKMELNSLRLVREFTQSMREATQTALVEGVRRGMNPLQVAKEFQGAIGLTQAQERAVQNYRGHLERNSRVALNRELRDRRFDPTVQRALDGTTGLSTDQINRMVERYRERMVQYRARVIARTESLRAVQQANHEMYLQAIEGGQIAADSLLRKWNPAKDDRVRNSHEQMRGQLRGMEEPFISGLGNLLMYPTDPEAPADDTIQCRCSLSIRFRKASTGPLRSR